MSEKLMIYKVQIELTLMYGKNTWFQNIGYFKTKEKAKIASEDAVRRYYEQYGSEENKDYTFYSRGNYLIENKPHITEITVL